MTKPIETEAEAHAAAKAGTITAEEYYAACAEAGWVARTLADGDEIMQQAATLIDGFLRGAAARLLAHIAHGSRPGDMQGVSNTQGLKVIDWLRTLVLPGGAHLPSREEIAAACRQLEGALSHSQLDDMLATLGIQELTEVAGRNPEASHAPGRKARVAALLQYALGRPMARTVDGKPLGAALVAYAAAHAAPEGQAHVG